MFSQPSLLHLLLIDPPPPFLTISFSFPKASICLPKSIIISQVFSFDNGCGYKIVKGAPSGNLQQEHMRHVSFHEDTYKQLWGEPGSL